MTFYYTLYLGYYISDAGIKCPEGSAEDQNLN
jgi:hypothetical protein